MSGSGPDPRTGSARSESARSIALVVHGLFAAGIILGITPIIGVVIAYIKRADAEGTPYASHLTYAIRTFWIALAIGMLSTVLMVLVVGVVVLALGLVWYIIRVVRAVLAWVDRKPIDEPTRFV
jgi:uncharacterized membrane protein